MKLVIPHFMHPIRLFIYLALQIIDDTQKTE